MKLTLIGCGCGRGTLTLEARAAIEKAQLLVGAPRLLEEFPEAAERKPARSAKEILEALQQAGQLLNELGLDSQYVPVYAEDTYLIDPENVVKTSTEGGKYTEDITVGRVWDIVYERAVNGNIVEDYGEK